MNSSGDITMCLVPSRQAVFSLSTTSPALLICTFVGQRRARDVAAQLLWRLAVLGGVTHCRVQARTQLVGTKLLRERGITPCTVKTVCPVRAPKAIR